MMRSVGDHVFIQLNHPRHPSFGYFDIIDFDRETARAMLNPASIGLPDADLNDMNFDAVEVANDFDSDQFAASLDDWLSLVAHGHRAAATGSSDCGTP